MEIVLQSHSKTGEDEILFPHSIEFSSKVFEGSESKIKIKIVVIRLVSHFGSDLAAV